MTWKQRWVNEWRRKIVLYQPWKSVFRILAVTLIWTLGHTKYFITISISKQFCVQLFFMYIWGSEEWKVHMIASYLLLISFCGMWFKNCNTSERSVWTARVTIRNKFHMVTFHERLWLFIVYISLGISTFCYLLTLVLTKKKKEYLWLIGLGVYQPL